MLSHLSVYYSVFCIFVPIHYCLWPRKRFSDNNLLLLNLVMIAFCKTEVLSIFYPHSLMVKEEGVHSIDASVDVPVMEVVVVVEVVVAQ